jgi:RNA polymerase sigma factor (sigma-70 family)
MTDSVTMDNHLGELMQAAQAGDAGAYTQLLEEMTPRIRQVVRGQRRFLQAADIEDLVQDILLSVHAVRATYDPQRPFLPWLLAITRNRLADGARRYVRSTAHEVHVENMAVTFADKPANTTVDSYGDLQELKEAIASLPPIQRDAIQMLKLGEMSLKEAAVASNTTAGALKVATHRAMTALRKMLLKGRSASAIARSLKGRSASAIARSLKER